MEGLSSPPGSLGEFPNCLSSAPSTCLMPSRTPGSGLAEFQQVTLPNCLHFICPLSLEPSFADSCAAGSSFMTQLAGDPPDGRETWGGLLPTVRLLVVELCCWMSGKKEGEESGGRGLDPPAGGEGGCSPTWPDHEWKRQERLEPPTHFPHMASQLWLLKFYLGPKHAKDPCSCRPPPQPPSLVCILRPCPG